MEETLSFDRQIAFHRCKNDYKSSEKNTLHFGYEERRYDRMSRDLYLADDILKQKTIDELCLDFKRVDFITMALLSSDILSVLLTLFKHKLPAIRERAADAIVYLQKQVCSTKIGKQKIIEDKAIIELIELIHDPVSQIRLNIYDALLNFSQFIEGITHMLTTDIIVQLVDKIVEEKDESVLLKVLQLTKQLLHGQDGTEQILKTPAITRYCHLLEHKNENLREWAGQCLAAISYNESGKQEVIDKKSVIPLCKKLNDECIEVREAVTIALASLAQLKQGKVEMLENNYFTQINEMLEDCTEQIKLHIVQLITSLAEHPDGRKLAQGSLPKLREMQQDQENNEFLLPYIQQAIDVITWIP